MAIEYFVLYQDGVHWQQEPAIIEWDPDECSLLDFMYQAIGCSSIECIRFRNFSGVVLGIVDEEGLFKSNLRANAVGSLMYGQRIVGRMLVGQQGERNGEPDIVGYPSKRDAWHAHCMIQNHIHRM